MSKKGGLPSLRDAMRSKGRKTYSLGARSKGTGGKQAASDGSAKPKDGDRLWRRKR